MRLDAALAVLLCAVVSGCAASRAPSSVTPTVSREALATDITTRLGGSGEQPRSVRCDGDLIGEVGSTVRCDVVVGDDESKEFQPVVTVTRIVGDAIEYELTPALSRAQLERTVRRLAAEKSSAPVDSVSCDAGLVGQVGSVAHCEIDVGGVRSRRAVEVTGVEGMTMNFTLQTN